MSHRVDFSTAELKTAPFNRGRTIETNGKRFRLAEFDAGFVEDGWCLKGHHGCVLSGELEIEFAEGPEQFHPGDGLSIPAGETHKHRAIVKSGTVRLFLIEDV